MAGSFTQREGQKIPVTCNVGRSQLMMSVPGFKTRLQAGPDAALSFLFYDMIRLGGAEGLVAAHSGAVPFVRDGLLLLHKEGIYAAGATSPLALLWKDAGCCRHLLDTDAAGTVPPLQVRDTHHTRLAPSRQPELGRAFKNSGVWSSIVETGLRCYSTMLRQQMLPLACTSSPLKATPCRVQMWRTCLVRRILSAPLIAHVHLSRNKCWGNELYLSIMIQVRADQSEPTL